MPVFPSQEWMSAFCAHLIEHPDAATAATALDGIYRFVVEPAGPLAESHRYDVEIRPADGSSASVAARPAQDATAVNLSLTANYERWRQLILGELDIGLAVMLRRLKVSGDLSRLTSQTSSLQPLVDALRSVDTQWR